MRLSSFAPSLLLLAPLSAQLVEQEVASEPLPALFAETETQPLPWVGVDDVTIRSRTVEVDLDLLLDTNRRTGERGMFTLNLFPGEAPTAFFDYTEPAYSGGTIWVGSIEGDELGSAIFSIMDEVVTATIRWQGQLYRLEYGGNGVHRINMVDETLFKGCATDPAMKGPVSTAISNAARDGAQTKNSRGNPDIDIMVVYSTAAKNAVGGTNSMLSRINLAFTETNSGYAQSGVTQDVILVHTEEMVGYNEPASFSTILTHLASKNDGNMDSVHATRNQYSADAVAMICQNGQYCGIAYLMTFVSNNFESSAFSVTNYSCATGYYSFGHELGHNFGCNHDPNNASGGAYSYSLGYRTPNNQFRTVMAYSPGTRILRWSGPSVTYAGNTMGNAGQDNARTLNNTAATTSEWRQSGLVANFSANPTSGTAPLNVNFTDTSSGGPSTYSWTFGDGGTSSQQNPSHTYNAPGSYTATLTVSGGGDSDTTSTIITVNELPPTAGFSATPTAGAKPLNVAFTNTSSGVISGYSWDFGDGSSSTQANPSHTYNNTGGYTVTLTTTGPGGSDTASLLISVFETPPVADFTASTTSGSAPLNVNFTDNSAGIIWFYTWDFGDGGSSSSPSPSHTYNSTGNFTASLTVTGPGGVDTHTEVISVGTAAPTASFNASPTSGTAPLAVNFNDTSSGSITSYLWDFGDGGSSTQANPSHNYTAAGVYDVSLTVTGPGGSDTDTQNALITVTEAAPTAGFNASTTYGAAPLMVNFTSTSSGAINTYLWDFGDGGSSNQANPSYSYVTPGTYTVSLTVTGPGGSDTDTQPNLVTAEPAAQFTPYGCGVNPAGSLTVLSGMPRPGETFTVGIDNPVGTQNAGSFPVMTLSTQPDPNFPCGTSLPGFGMNGPGELLIDISGGAVLQPALIGGPWAGPGTPAPVAVPVPNDPSLIGFTVYGQGLLFDPSAGAGGVKFGFTTALEMNIGL